MRCPIAMTFALIVMTGIAPASGQQPDPEPALTQLHSRLLPLLRRYYPDVKWDLAGDLLVYEHDVRRFCVHHALKTGEWQEAVEVLGPNRRGIRCAIALVRESYQGALLITPYNPQTYQEPYFLDQVTLAPSPDGSAHLLVHLWYPGAGGMDRAFLKDFNDIIDRAWRAAEQPDAPDERAPAGEPPTRR